MKVEIWSDIMCPFCYIGKRHFEEALKQFPDSASIEVQWKSFQLNPYLPDKPSEDNIYQYLANSKGISYDQSVQMHEHVTKMAANAGLNYNFDHVVVSSSFNAHRVIQMGKSKGLGDQVKERLLYAYFTEGQDMSNHEVLTRLGKETGLSEKDVEIALTSDEFAYRVKQDIQEAQQIGVTGVPFFVFNRKYGASGAQPAEYFVQLLEKSFNEWKEEQDKSGLEITEGPSCSTDGEC